MTECTIRFSHHPGIDPGDAAMATIADILTAMRHKRSVLVEVEQGDTVSFFDVRPAIASPGELHAIRHDHVRPTEKERIMAWLDHAADIESGTAAGAAIVRLIAEVESGEWPKPPTCILTDENIATEDDCTTHDHELQRL